MKSATPASQPKLLVIEDSPEDLGLLMNMLLHRQMRLHVALDGDDGFNKALLVQPDLILLDLVMPRLDGFATCRLLKAHPQTRSIPVIFLSAANSVDKRIQGLSLGGVDFIGKPFVAEEVIARVEVHLQLRRQAWTEPVAPGQTSLTQLPATHESSPPLLAAEANCAGLEPLRLRDQLLVRRAQQYLQEHLREPPDMDGLCRQLGCNEKRLNQSCQAAIGMTLFAWLREERLRQARGLLTGTDLPIAAIAEHLGYSSQANFARAFRDRFGCSASQLRLQLQQRPPNDALDQA